ncbi:hypothetical protein ASZ78_010830 [Callipepla squamata]|uniref:PH domain-containing protein n=1 Tax=Callipepla squamata TaxID=9009 RepID=A0A226N599_CALSU|nr:hypothetical protein ASZ78_010830 [Callipepla squamata]
MDEAVVKQGVLHMQLQQTFGKKWKKYWGILYRETPCSTARLELFEGSDKPRKGESSRRLVKMSDCVHVAEAGGEASCPRSTTAFLLETTEKRYLLAAEGGQAQGWVRRLCQLAFPGSQEEQAAGKDMQLSADGDFSMEENSLYSSRGKGECCVWGGGVEHDFEVTLRATESSERCRLRGRFVLRAGEEALELRDVQSGDVLYRNFEFETRQGNEIFQVIESAIAVQRERGGPGDQQSQLPERAQEREEHRAKSTYTQPLLHAGPSAVPKAPEKGRGKDAGGEMEYAVPFDTIAKSLMAGKFGGVLHGPAGNPDPLYDSIQEAGGRPALPRPRAKPEHIYDEPESVCPHTVYHEPQEVKGEAWRLQAAPEDPSGHEYPYNAQRDDYAVPKRAVPLRQGKEWLGDTEYDNVVFQLAKKKNKQ